MNAEYYPGRLQSLIPDSMLMRLDSGDVAFSGANGVTVGIELKKVSDALSCLYSSRLADSQLPEMAKAYDVRYLVIEELYRAEPSTGVLQRWKSFPSEKDTKCGRWYDAHAGRNYMMYQTFEMWLHTMSELGQARLERTADIEGTASLIQALHTWWSREVHSSFDVMHQAEGNGAALTRPKMMQRIIAHLPHVGWERSKELRQRIGRVQFYRKDGKPMQGEDWYIEGQIAEKSASDIDAACEGKDE